MKSKRSTSTTSTESTTDDEYGESFADESGEEESQEEEDEDSDIDFGLMTFRRRGQGHRAHGTTSSPAPPQPGAAKPPIAYFKSPSRSSKAAGKGKARAANRNRTPQSQKKKSKRAVKKSASLDEQGFERVTDPQEIENLIHSMGRVSLEDEPIPYGDGSEERPIIVLADPQHPERHHGFILHLFQKFTHEKKLVLLLSSAVPAIMVILEATILEATIVGKRLCRKKCQTS